MPVNKTILLVEDDQYLRDLYQEVLTEAGYAVDTAGDGEVGLAKLQTGSYGLVLLDMMMPKLDGIQVLTYLKDHPVPHPPERIVLLTNMAHSPVIDQATELGAQGCIIKSDVTPDLFVQRVNGFWLH